MEFLLHCQYPNSSHQQLMHVNDAAALNSGIEQLHTCTAAKGTKSVALQHSVLRNGSVRHSPVLLVSATFMNQDP